MILLNTDDDDDDDDDTIVKYPCSSNIWKAIQVAEPIGSM